MPPPAPARSGSAKRSVVKVAAPTVKRSNRSVAGALAPPAVADRAALLATADESLLDVVDNLLNRGVLLEGELVLGLAGVDLVYARLSVLLCAVDRLLPR